MQQQVADCAPAPSWGARHPLAAGFAASSFSVATATFLTNWIDVIKVRQQLAGPSAQNLVSTCVNVVREDGAQALMRGTTPAVARGLLYGGLRIGLYSPFKDTLAGEGQEAGLAEKIAAGMASGSVAAAVCNPTDLVKTRMQAAGVGRLGPMEVAASVVQQEGVRGLWKGTSPSMARAALLTAAQCATYDEVKGLFLGRLGWEDSLGTHLAVSGVAGLVTTTVISPADVVKTNMFVNSTYASPWECFTDIWRRQGVRGMFKGWTANWARQGPMTTVSPGQRQQQQR